MKQIETINIPNGENKYLKSFVINTYNDIKNCYIKIYRNSSVLVFSGYIDINKEVFLNEPYLFYPLDQIRYKLTANAFSGVAVNVGFQWITI